MSRPRGGGLTPRLVVAQVAVAVAGVGAAAAVAVLVGPPLFSEHLHRAGHGMASQAEIDHAEEAYRWANVLSLSIALVAAVVVALGTSALMARRIGRPLAAASAAAAAVAAGRYDARVPPARLGAEFEALTTSFNQMAGRLQAVETTRRGLLADLGHELRTPVATIDAYLEGVEDGVATLDAATVAMLRGHTARLRRLAEDVSAVVAAEEHRLELRRERLAVADLVSAVATGARERTEQGEHAGDVRIEDDAPPGLPDVLGDPDRLGQVLGNLVENALRHTPSGTVRITAAAARGGGVEIAVTDTGEGVAAEHLPHLFERFYRADRARDRRHGGSGIGLSIAKALVEAHGGTIRIASPGRGLGTTVVVWLPAA